MTDRIIPLHELLPDNEIQALSAVASQVGNDTVLFPSNSTPCDVLVCWNQLSSDVHAEHCASNREVERLHGRDRGRGDLDETYRGIQLGSWDSMEVHIKEIVREEDLC